MKKLTVSIFIFCCAAVNVVLFGLRDPNLPTYAKSENDTIGLAMGDFTKKVKGTVSKAGGKVKSAATDVGGKVKGAVTDVGGKVKGAATDVGGKVKDVAGAIGRGITGAVTGVKGTVEGVLAGVKDEVQKYSDEFSSANFKQAVQEQYKKEAERLGIASAEVINGVKVTADGQLDPNSEEGKYIQRRLAVAQPALEEFTGLKFERNEVPRIGCAFSGGGYRAMILTAGFLRGLEDIGLIDGVTNMAGLSGSTWCLGPWTFMQSEGSKVTAAQFSESIIQKIRKKRLNIKAVKPVINFKLEQYAGKVFWPKIVFDKVYSSVDVYGALLSYYLLGDFGDKRFTMYLYDQLSNIRSGNGPWPSYTAVSMHKANGNYLYNWYEFNPAEVRNLENNLAIPSYSFGRKFENGVATDLPPQETFGFLMGIFGSAYTVNMKDIKRIVFGDTEKPSDGITEKMNKIKTLVSKGDVKDAWEVAKPVLSQVQMEVFRKVVEKIAGEDKLSIPMTGIRVGTARVSPAQVRNPFKGYPAAQAWLKPKKDITLVDGGIAYNIPIRTMFRPERDIDLIIVGDASGNVPKTGNKDLLLGFEDIKRFYGINYEKDEQLSSKTMEVWHPVETAYANVDAKFKGVMPPSVVYFNFLKDDELIKGAEADPSLQQVVAGSDLKNYTPMCVDEYCGTMNFDYTEKEFRQLSGIAEFNIKAQQGKLKKLVGQVAEARKKKVSGLTQ